MLLWHDTKLHTECYYSRQTSSCKISTLIYHQHFCSGHIRIFSQYKHEFSSLQSFLVLFYSKIRACRNIWHSMRWEGEKNLHFSILVIQHLNNFYNKDLYMTSSCFSLLATRKTKSNSFVSKTFFLVFLWVCFFEKELCETRLSSPWGKVGEEKRLKKSAGGREETERRSETSRLSQKD